MLKRWLWIGACLAGLSGCGGGTEEPGTDTQTDTSNSTDTSDPTDTSNPADTSTEGDTSACVPSCANAACGDDGCGGSCGDCGPDATCTAARVCEQKTGACGLCHPGTTCGTNPDEPAVCGGGACGTFDENGACENGLLVWCADGVLVSVDCEYLSDGENACAYVPENNWYDCVAKSCTPDCDGRVCGDDGCGGSCGTCASGTCNDGKCEAGSWPSEVTLLTLDGNGTASASGEMSAGTEIGAEWMVDDAINCHTGADVNGTSAKLYDGPHVLYALSAPLPGYSRIEATVTATTSGDDPRVYVLALPKGTRALPSQVERATGCTARYNPSYNGAAVKAGWNNENAGEYEVIIGVAGGQFDKGFSSTGFSLAVKVTPLETPVCHDMPWDDNSNDNWFPTPPTFYPDFVTQLEVSDEGLAQTTGNLSEGMPLCELDFAWNSQVACFPETQAYLYTGNTRFYAFELPRPGVATVTITPDPGVDVSAYGFQMGTTSFYTPPNVPTAICEQSPKKNFATVGGAGQAESLTFVSTGNPYHIVIAVTGPNGANEGGYVLDVNMKLAAEDTCGALWSQAKLTSWPTAATEWYPGVKLVKTDATTGKVSVAGDLSTGKTLCSLAFAWQSNVACFTQPQSDDFAGNQNFYALDGGVGPGEVITVTVTPKTASVDVSLYGYWMSQGSFYVPPNVVSVGACEASHDQSLSSAGDAGAPETITFMNPTGNRYNYFFAVAGPAGVTFGAYDIQVTRVTPPPPFCPESLPGATYSTWPTNMPRIVTDDEGKGYESGNLADGQCVNLTFASSSQNACFPGTQNDNFEGNQVFFTFEEPLAPHSTLDIIVRPKTNFDLSVYGYMLGLNNFRLPPNLPSSLSCEASYATNVGGNPGAPESLHFENPTDSNYYNVVLVVSGVAGVTAGDFDIEVTRREAEPYCPESLPGISSPSSFPASVERVTLASDGTATIPGKLEEGACTNLGFAEQSTVACFPATQFGNFMGPQNFYAVDIGPGDVIDIAVTPDPGVDVNLYGYQMGLSSFYTPPNVPTVATCEASYDAQTGFNPGEIEYIHFESPGSNSYHIFFAVSGTPLSGTGSYTIDIVKKTAPPPFCPGSLPGGPNANWPAGVTLVNVDDDGVGQATGNLNTGACSNLRFASDSSVACFPATENANFTGNMVKFALAEPIPPNSVASIEVIPAAGVDVSLFGYTMGLASFYVPPYVPSISVCEASYGAAAPNPGATESITFVNPTGNSYNAFFAVAGASGLTAGAFTVRVKIDTAEPFCPESLPGVPNGTSWPASVQVLTPTSGTASASGNLSTGACTSLSFAWDSNIACFPATWASAFQGNHKYYALNTPVPPNKKVTVKVTPSAGVDAAVYIYRMSTSSFYVPPFVPSVASCEFAAVAGAGAAETVVLPASNNGNSYNVFFAVAGSSGTTSGAYNLTVTID